MSAAAPGEPADDGAQCPEQGEATMTTANPYTTRPAAEEGYL